MTYHYIPLIESHWNKFVCGHLGLMRMKSLKIQGLDFFAEGTKGCDVSFKAGASSIKFWSIVKHRLVVWRPGVWWLCVFHALKVTRFCYLGWKSKYLSVALALLTNWVKVAKDFAVFTFLVTSCSSWIWKQIWLVMLDKDILIV